jgi:hypothetical protein
MRLAKPLSFNYLSIVVRECRLLAGGRELLGALKVSRQVWGHADLELLLEILVHR